VKTFYPQTALEGFGAVVAAELGVSVSFATGQPATDGKTVYLPPIKSALTQSEFDSICGTAIHEVAHVYYQTVPFHQRFSAVSRLHAAASNFIMDVADETRIEERLPKAAKLIRLGNVEADERFAQTVGKMNAVDAILGAAFAMARLGQCKTYKAVWKKHPHWREMGKAYLILRSVAHRRGASAGPKRSKAQWDRYAKAIDDLVKLLAPFGQPDQADKTFGMMGAVVPNSGAEQPGVGDAIADGQQGAGVLLGNVQPGQSVAEQASGDAVTVAVPGVGPGNGLGAGAGDGTGPRQQDAPCRMNKGLYTQLRPCLVGAVERIARHDESDGLGSGFYSGPKIGAGIERALIDGGCFVRRNAEGEKLHAAIMLDNSGSMKFTIDDVSAVGQAFADAVKGVAASVSLATFTGYVQTEQDFRNVSAGGGTMTGKALEWAEEQLTPCNGRRVCVILTDGDTADFDVAVKACESMRSKGIAVIGIAYTIPGDSIRKSMPGAHVIEANDPTMLAVQLATIAGRIAR